MKAGPQTCTQGTPVLPLLNLISFKDTPCPMGPLLVKWALNPARLLSDGP